MPETSLSLSWTIPSKYGFPFDARYLTHLTTDMDAVARFWRAGEAPEYSSTDRFDLLALEVAIEDVGNFRQLDSPVAVVFHRHVRVSGVQGF